MAGCFVVWKSDGVLSRSSLSFRQSGACRPSLRCSRVAFASGASAALRPDPDMASEEVITSLQVPPGFRVAFDCFALELFISISRIFTILQSDVTETLEHHDS